MSASRLATLHATTLNQIQQALTPPDEQLDQTDQNFLILDDSLVGPLSIYMHAALLRTLNYTRWYRLLASQEIPTLMKRSFQSKVQNSARVAVILSSRSNAIESVIRLALDVSAVAKAHKSRVSLTLHFMPRRETLAVSSILTALQDLGVPTARDTTLTYKHLDLNVRDLPIVIFPVDDSSVTMCQEASLKRYSLEGDDRVLGEIVEAALIMLKSNFQINESSYVVGVGTCGSRIGRALQKRIRMMTSSGGEDCEGGEDVSESRCHEVATELICNADAESIGRPLPVHGRALTRAMHKLGERGGEDIMGGVMRDEIEFVRVKEKEAVTDNLQDKVDKLNFRIRFPAAENQIDSIETTSEDPLLLRSVIVMDRSSDYVSPFVAPFTYEALLDVVYTIKANSVFVPESVFAGTQPGGLRLKLSVDEDPVLKLIRDLPHTELGPALHRCALQLQNTFQREKAPETWTVSDMQSFVSDLRLNEGKHRHLKDHIHITGHLVTNLIKNPSFYTLLRLEDEIMSGSSSFGDVVDVLCGMCDRDASISDVYRLAILNSHINSASYDRTKQLRIRQSLFRHHGLWEVYRWQQLEKAGILYDGNKAHQSGLTNWNGVKRCISEWASNESQFKSSSDIDFSFVHSGYSPISVKIIQALCEDRRRFWAQLQRLAGDAKEEQTWSSRILATGTRLPVNTNLATKPGVLVILPNGCSWSELAALRYLAESFKADRTLLILTSEVYGFRSFIQQYSACHLHKSVRLREMPSRLDVSSRPDVSSVEALDKLLPPKSDRLADYSEELRAII